MRTSLIIAALVSSTLLGFTEAQTTISLFNGRDLSGWVTDVPAKDKDTNLPPSFVVRSNLLVSMGNPPGHLVSEKQYSNYRLDVEYRFAGEPGNCGVLVHASKPRALYEMFPQSVEVQLMSGNAGDFWVIREDIEVPDMEKRRGPKEKWGGGDKDARRILNLTDNSEKPPGEWNKLKIECLDRTIKVWVNGDLVNAGFNCTKNEGKIAVQAEGSVVEFRRIELTPLQTGK